MRAYSELKKQLLQNEKVKTEYERLETEYQVIHFSFFRMLLMFAQNREYKIQTPTNLKFLNSYLSGFCLLKKSVFKPFFVFMK